MSELPETHYDTATLAREQLACAESLFYAITKLLEDANSRLMDKPGNVGVALTACQHAAVLARLGAMEAGAGSESFQEAADTLERLEAESLSIPSAGADLDEERDH